MNTQKTLWSVVAIASLGLLFFRPALARTGNDWHTPMTLDIRQQPTVYGSFGQFGQAHYYRLPVASPTTLSIQIAIPLSAQPLFRPQVVLFSPDITTAGPLLPIAQPTRSVALVYPDTTPKLTFNIATQSLYEVRLEAQPKISSSGNYYLAVYPTSSTGYAGRYRLSISQPPGFGRWSDIWTYPYHWWYDQAFADWSWRTLITPVLLIVFGWLAWRFVIMSPTKRKKTITRKT